MTEPTWPIPMWNEFWPWAQWRLQGAPKPAPDRAKLLARRWHKQTGLYGVPPWAWDRLREIQRLRAKDAELEKALFYNRPGGWTAWGFENGQFEPYSLFERARAQGFKWVGVQATEFNVFRGAKFRAAADAAGLDLVVWEWATSSYSAAQAISAFRADSFSANVEHPGPWGPYAYELRRQFPHLPLSVFTNFAGTLATPQGNYDRELARPWVDNDFAWITEAYMVNEQGPQPTLAPQNLDWTAKTHGGVPKTYPAFGIYRCGPEQYDDYLASFPGHSWYLLEYHPAFR